LAHDREWIETFALSEVAALKRFGVTGFGGHVARVQLRFTPQIPVQRLLYRVSIDGGDSQLVSDKHIRGPAAASPDGKTLAVFFLDQNVEPPKWKILIATLEGEPIRTIDPSQPIVDRSVLDRS
jgi:hypothetical protein